MDPGRAQAWFWNQEGFQERRRSELPRPAALGGEEPSVQLPEQAGPPTHRESSCAPRGSGSASRDNEVTSPERRLCSHGPLAASPHAQSLPVTAVAARLSEGICHKTWWAGRGAPGSWPDAVRNGLAPGFEAIFQLCCFFFLLSLLGAVFFFLFISCPALVSGRQSRFLH